MKSSDEKNKSKKGSKPKESIKTGKVTVVNSPLHEDIREKANELYLQRIERGEHGTPEDDWLEAEKLLSNS